MKSTFAIALLATASAVHYGDPNTSPGCLSDEVKIQVTGVAGDFCSPECDAKGACPTDVPTGVTAKPTCALSSSAGAKYCALVCAPSLPIRDQATADGVCGPNASCKAISGTGVCTYDDGPTPPPAPPTPPPAPTPSPGPTPANWKKSKAGIIGAIAVGGGMADGENIFVAGGESASGARVLFSSDGGESFSPEIPAPGTALILDCEAQTPKSAICSGIGGVMHTTNGLNWTKSIEIGGGQSAEKLGKGYAVTGGAAVHTTADAGAFIFQTKKLTGCDTATAPGRYGAFPSANTWYVSAGSFPTAPPSQSPTASPYETVHHLSEIHEMRRDLATNATKLVSTMMEKHPDMVETTFVGDGPAAVHSGADTYTAAIYKTTDAGATWTTINTDTGNFYYNGIHCSDDDHCVVTAEAHGSVSAPGGHIFTTANGGANWTQTHFEPNGGMMAARFTSAGSKEVWVAGTGTKAREPCANMYHSTDSGNTWATYQVPLSSPIGMDCFDSTHCIAPAVLPITQQCTLLTYHN